MATSKSKADVKSVRNESKTALKGFPKSRIRKAFVAMADQAGSGDEAQHAKSLAALDITKAARAFRKANPDVSDLGTISKGWRDHLNGVTLELATAGNRFAEMTAATKDKPATAKLTGYGNNVASIAKGVIEFDIDPDDCKGDEGVSYREVRKVVEARRADARRAEKPDEAAFQDACEAADKAWKELRTVVVGTKQRSAVEDLTKLLQDTLADVRGQIDGEDEGEGSDEEPNEENTQPESKAA